MSGDAYQDKAAAFAAELVVQAAWPVLLIVAAMMAAPFVGMVALPLASPLTAAAWLVAAASAVATLAFSVLLLFDALLFRLMASHASETAGGAAVDDVLARMRLKTTAAVPRSLDQRMAGTRRLVIKQRIAFGLFAATSFAAAFL
ncbi:MULTISPECIES: hypothetical protein [unclassified Mesorhizobium]|uniref:hypothetical protein n=1 Tax=unclassified Mesorhizobium TaxID=325217 RepID=UPI000FD7C317|nr:MULTISPECIES: hypothetical protein [unclassified Mesorhizobium]TGQ34684.1 hypothetical protein EN859_024925 [Mesorhizobium sp. M00.F.Ca.ET.216.01.1.1]TIS57584.1 MAG: hypothetical protein E5W91_13565 [Mesorhizobium sp.]TIS88639.1 MAG: hypothetical protein E5W89_19970 [Mesorhizobium sp.]TJW07280.1 MAG: hypothetical protein E5W82_24015 [Mesorhizobium sp.]